MIQHLIGEGGQYVANDTDLQVSVCNILLYVTPVSLRRGQYLSNDTHLQVSGGRGVGVSYINIFLPIISRGRGVGIRPFFRNQKHNLKKYMT